MAPSSPRLPRMQNQSRARAPLERSLNIVSQVLEKTIKQKTSSPPPMMRQYDLIERVKRYNPQTSEALLNRAYVYAMKAHGEQKRASGDPYFSHPLEVAGILTDLKLDDATIAAALLHDTIEDTTATRAEIDQMFGKDIGALVEGLTKLKKLELVTKEAKQAENLRKLLLAIADDVRVLLVKLADRLHNMRTLSHMPPEARRRSAEETLDIYAPLAGRMGMHGMREELEDLAFRELNSEAYAVISERLDALEAKNVGLVTEIEQQLAEYGIAAHALYKDGLGSPTEMLSRESSAYAWLRRTIELLVEGSNPEEFLEHTKLELFHDQVFCFTPKGKLIALPRGANAIDFAYAVHTDVGNMAVGCKINGKIAPLVSELANGDEVEIITSLAQTAPPPAWESLVTTGKARAAIRRATRAAVRSQYAGLGRRIVERLCQRAKIAYSDDKPAGPLPG